MIVDEGSFRDRSSRVFYQGGAVLRALDRCAAEDWKHLSQARFFEDFIRQGRLIPTKLLDHLPDALPPGEEWCAVLQHERIPFVSYPYEWTFGMLRDAALLHLDLLASARRRNDFKGLIGIQRAVGWDPACLHRYTFLPPT